MPIKQRNAGFISATYQPLQVANAPTIGAATAGDASASVAFTAPANVGGSAISAYYAVSNPDRVTVSGASSPINVTGLTNGTAYTFTVWALNTYGPSPFSGASGSVSPSAPTAFWGGGNDSSDNQVNVISYQNISTLGNAIDFGDLASAKYAIFSCSSSTRGIWAGGSTPAISTISFITLASTGNASFFGNLPQGRYGGGCLSNSTRGIFAGSATLPYYIDYITIATAGNSVEFGQIPYPGASFNTAAFASTTRGVWAGASGGPENTISYVTISTLGNSQDFGDLTVGMVQSGGASNSTRGLIGGAYAAGVYNVINYVTIATTGNAIDFGDLNTVGYGNSAASSSTRALFGGGLNANAGFAKNNAVEYVTISTTGNALDFGDLTLATYELSACSNAHGGLS